MFGMGTGGSLRLLSPEIGQGPNPFAAAWNAVRSSTLAAAFLVPSDRPSNGLPTSSVQLGFEDSLDSSRSSSLAASGFAPSKPHRLDRFAPPTKIRSFNPQHSLAFRSRFRLFSHKLLHGFGPGLRFGSLRSLSLASSLLLPTAFSLLPLSKIKPSTD